MARMATQMSPMKALLSNQASSVSFRYLVCQASQASFQNLNALDCVVERLGILGVRFL